MSLFHRGADYTLRDFFVKRQFLDGRSFVTTDIPGRTSNAVRAADSLYVRDSDLSAALFVESGDE